MRASESYGQRIVEEQRHEWALLKAAEKQRKISVQAERVRREVELQVAATPETLRKARECVAERMFEDQRMTAEQYQASCEIVTVWEAITRRLFARTSRMGEVGAAEGAEWPPSLCRAYRDNYTPWRALESKIVVGGGKTRCDLVFGFSVDNNSPNRMAAILGIHHRVAKDQICESLFRYAEIAGWITRKNMPVLLGSEASLFGA